MNVRVSLIIRLLIFGNPAEIKLDDLVFFRRFRFERFYHQFLNVSTLR